MKRFETEDAAYRYVKDQPQDGDLVLVADEEGLERVVMTAREAIENDFCYTAVRRVKRHLPTRLGHGR